MYPCAGAKNQESPVRSPVRQRSWRCGLCRLLARVRAAGSARQSARRIHRQERERLRRARRARRYGDRSGDLVAGHQDLAPQPGIASRRGMEAPNVALAQCNRLLEPGIHLDLWPERGLSCFPRLVSGSRRLAGASHCRECRITHRRQPYLLARLLHFGRINGIGIPCSGPGLCDQTTKALWAIFGLAPAAMFVTGAIMWWNRVLLPVWQALAGDPPCRDVPLRMCEVMEPANDSTGGSFGLPLQPVIGDRPRAKSTSGTTMPARHEAVRNSGTVFSSSRDRSQRNQCLALGGTSIVPVAIGAPAYHKGPVVGQKKALDAGRDHRSSPRATSRHR